MFKVMKCHFIVVTQFQFNVNIYELEGGFIHRHRSNVHTRIRLEESCLNLDSRLIIIAVYKRSKAGISRYIYCVLDCVCHRAHSFCSISNNNTSQNLTYCYGILNIQSSKPQPVRTRLVQHDLK